MLMLRNDTSVLRWNAMK